MKRLRLSDNQIAALRTRLCAITPAVCACCSKGAFIPGCPVHDPEARKA